jgi:hypothetical protein
MVKLISFKSTEFSHILVVNEIICFILVSMTKDERMT